MARVCLQEMREFTLRLDIAILLVVSLLGVVLYMMHNFQNQSCDVRDLTTVWWKG